jgi:hypothetical protein
LEDDEDPREKEVAEHREGERAWHDGESVSTCAGHKGWALLRMRGRDGERTAVRILFGDFWKDLSSWKPRGQEKGAGDKR